MADLDDLRSLLRETTTLVLGTIDSDGTPRATPLFFAPDGDLSLVFLSDPASIHSANLVRDPAAAAAAFAHVEDWRAIHGVQMKGRAAPLPPQEQADAMLVYAARFPFLDGLRAALAGSRAYRFVPRWVRWIDNRRGFGYQVEWLLE